MTERNKQSKTAMVVAKRLAFDRTIAEARDKFADMPTEELESLIDEACAAARGRSR